MTCNRCSDIHQAQSEGKQLNSCKCPCHSNFKNDLVYNDINGSDKLSITEQPFDITDVNNDGSFSFGMNRLDIYDSTDNEWIPFGLQTDDKYMNDFNTYKMQTQRLGYYDL